MDVTIIADDSTGGTDEHLGPSGGCNVGLSGLFAVILAAALLKAGKH